MNNIEELKKAKIDWVNKKQGGYNKVICDVNLEIIQCALEKYKRAGCDITN